MALNSGTKLGPYEVIAPLGSGGMGEVYRARDTKLNREVALKVLPAAMAHDVERMARFQREAQVLASLNHANIASIYGLEDSSGVYALVMELVEGPTLAERIGAARPLTPSPSPQGRGEKSALAVAVAARRRPADCQTNRRGARIRARARDHSPRPETRERQDHARRHRQGFGFRTCEGARGHCACIGGRGDS